MHQSFITVSYSLEMLDEKKKKIKVKFGVKDSPEMCQLLTGNKSEDRAFYDGDSIFSFYH